MGTSISGGMIVGEIGSKLCVPEDWGDDEYVWAENNEMSYLSPRYADGFCDSYVGFKVSDVSIDDDFNDWVAKLKQLAIKFKEITGVEARLIGSLDVTKLMR